jgi:hypothetical protein
MHDQPGEAEPGMFGGNSNWRGPAQFSVDHFAQALCQLLRRGLQNRNPTGSGIGLSIDEVDDELSGRLTRIFRKNANGRRPVHGRDERLQNAPRFKDYLLFHEYFHGDESNGLMAKLLQPHP